MKVAQLLLASTVGILICSSSLFAQRFAPPEGEIIVHHESYDYEGMHGQSIVTSRHIYDRWTDNKGIYGDARQEFEAPEGRYIVSAERKEGIYVLLLDNGDVWKYGLRPGRQEGDMVYSAFKYNFRVGSGGSETFKKIVGDDMYALSSYSVYVSRDALASWHVDTLGFAHAHANTIVVDSDQNVYAATNQGLFFQPPHDSLWVVRGTTQNVSFAYVDRHNRLYRSIDTMLAVSTDRGLNWTSIANPTSQTISSIAQDFSGDLYAASGSAIFRSNLSGSTDVTAQLLSAASEPSTGSGLIILNIDADSIVSVNTNYGTFESRDHGTSWYRVDYGIPAERLYGLAHTASGAFVTSTSIGVFHTLALGSSWQRSQSALKGSGIQLYRAATALYAFRSTSPKFWTSSDDGATWDSISTSGLDIGGITVDESGAVHGYSSRYGASFKGYLYNWTNGTGWTYDTNGFTPKNYSFASTIASDGHGKLYASGSFPGGAKVMVRPIAGGAWTADTVGLGASTNYLAMFAAGPDLYGAVGNVIFQRLPGGWWQIPMPAPPPGRVTDIAELSDGTLFASFATTAGTGAGLYFTKDQGDNWTFAGYGDMEIQGFLSEGSALYATTDHGIYKITTSAGQFQFYVDPQAPQPINFGTVRIGDSLTKVLKFTTIGMRTPIFGAFTVFDSDFSTGPIPAYLVGPDSINLAVTFKPLSAGLHQSAGSLSISGIPLPFGVSGTGSSSEVASKHSSTVCTVYPNPLTAPSILHILAEESVTKTVVFNAMGERVLNVERGGDRLDLSGLPTGAYVVEITAGGTVTRQLIQYIR